MTIRAYISDKLKAFGVSEAQLVDMSLSSGLDLEADVLEQDPTVVGVALTNTLEELILAPKMTSVNESGFSISWDFANASQYYLWLCQKWGLTPKAEVLEALGLSVISDKTSKW